MMRVKHLIAAVVGCGLLGVGSLCSAVPALRSELYPEVKNMQS